MIGIENRNTKKKNGGRVYCYLNSLMQMLYCINELKNNTFLKPVFSLLNGTSGYITAETIVSIYQKKMYPEQNILYFNDPAEFLELTLSKITNNIKKKFLKNKNINNIITYNNGLQSFYFGLSGLNNSVEYKKYLFINIDKQDDKKMISFGKNGMNTINFIHKTIVVKKELNIKSKTYKLLGAIFVLSGPHYTFASYDDKGNVCRYYDDDKISNEIPSDNITLGKNAKLLLYKRV